MNISQIYFLYDKQNTKRKLIFIPLTIQRSSIANMLDMDILFNNISLCNNCMT